MANDHDYWNNASFGGQQTCADIVHYDSMFSESICVGYGISMSAINRNGLRCGLERAWNCHGTPRYSYDSMIPHLLFAISEWNSMEQLVVLK
jgi:hypothetical protein